MSEPTAGRPVLERLGVTYFRHLSRGVTVEDVDGVHFLNASERASIRRIVRAAVVRAALAGALSTIVSATAEVLAAPLGAGVRFWTIVLGATTLASIIEIGYLYWDGLRAVHRMAIAAGLDLFGQPVKTDPTRSERTAVAEALARAALELPNHAGQVLGVNPRRDASRLQLALASVVYKLKISVTNFVVKALVRRAIGRSALRGWLDLLVPFAAVPVTAAWNAVVAWMVLREARIRAMGPSAASELATFALSAAPKPSIAARHVAVRAVACSIVRTADLHPNLVALLELVAERLDVRPAADVDRAAVFLAELPRLGRAERTCALRLLCVAAVLDGRVTRAERRLLEQAFAVCDRRADLHAVERLRRAFVAGDRLDEAQVTAVA